MNPTSTPNIEPIHNSSNSSSTMARSPIETIQNQRRYFQQGNTHSLEFRREMLNKLYTAIIANQDKIAAALQKDLGKSTTETITTEIGPVLSEIRQLHKSLAKYMKPKKRRNTLVNFGAKSRIYSEPYGNVLIIGPWNYPFQLAMGPLAGAIAGGNTVILKPSELSEHTSNVIFDIIKATFESSYIATILGGIDETTLLLNQRFDMIFFTGSPAVGSIVMSAAAKHLTKVVLELGGKSPCIVDATANIELAAKRIAFAKLINAGQTCVAPDYLLVQNTVKDQFIAAYKRAVDVMFETTPNTHGDFGHIINQRHFNRLSAYLSNGKILYGGHVDAAKLHIDPTLIDIGTAKSLRGDQSANATTRGDQSANATNSSDLPIMNDEIFGPILPLITFEDINEIFPIIANNPDPLALYLFTENQALQDRIVARVPFGGGAINDALMHLTNEHLPFGGRGTSGMGAYHGAKSFDAFTHQKSVLHSPTWFDLSLKYPPFKEKQLPLVKRILYKNKL